MTGPDRSNAHTWLFRWFAAALLTLASVASAQDAVPGWVVIPVTDYQTLRAKAFPQNTEPEAASVDATLSRVEYELRVEDGVASGRATLTVDVLKQGMVRVPIPAGLLVRDARINGNPATLVPTSVANGGTQLSAVLSRPGRAVLVLDVALTVTSAAADEKLSLPPSLSGVTRATVTIGRQDLQIKVTGGVLSDTSQANGETRCLAYGKGGDALVLAWHRNIEEHRTEQPLRFRATLTELLGLGEDSTSVYTEVSVTVTQGVARQVRVELPASVTVNQVLGANVGDWEVGAGQLAVSFLEPVEQTAAFVVTGETRLPRDGSIDIPIAGVSGAERLAGGVAVEVIGAGEIKDARAQGIEKTDASELGKTIQSSQSPSLIAFRFRPGAEKVAAALTVQVARYEQQAVLTANIEEARYRVLMSQDGKNLVEARYAVRNNQRNFLKIVLPQGAVVWGASVSGRSVRPGQASDGSLLLPLAKSRSGEEAPASAVEILYVMPGARWEEKGRATLALPGIDLPASRTGLAVYYPPTFRVTAEPGPFRMQEYQEPSSAVLKSEPGAHPAAPNALAAARRPAPDALQQFNQNATQAGTQALVDKFLAKAEARRSASSLPLRMPFPAGPSLFLIAELTGEDQRPTVELNYQIERKRGGK